MRASFPGTFRRDVAPHAQEGRGGGHQGRVGRGDWRHVANKRGVLFILLAPGYLLDKLLDAWFISEKNLSTASCQVTMDVCVNMQVIFLTQQHLEVTSVLVGRILDVYEWLC